MRHSTCIVKQRRLEYGGDRSLNAKGGRGAVANPYVEWGERKRCRLWIPIKLGMGNSCRI